MGQSSENEGVGLGDWGGGTACLPARVAATRLLNLLNQTPQLSLIREESFGNIQDIPVNQVQELMTLG
jgi:hypothetical protein